MFVSYGFRFLNTRKILRRRHGVTFITAYYTIIIIIIAFTFPETLYVYNEPRGVIDWPIVGRYYSQLVVSIR